MHTLRLPDQTASSKNHRCKKVFYVFFYFGHHVFTFLTFFLYFPNVFYLKNVCKVQSGKQINKKHFQNNSNEIDLRFFCCVSNIEDFTASLKRRQLLQTKQNGIFRVALKAIS